jgi:hypothetical protein
MVGRFIVANLLLFVSPPAVVEREDDAAARVVTD